MYCVVRSKCQFETLIFYCNLNPLWTVCIYFLCGHQVLLPVSTWKIRELESELTGKVSPEIRNFSTSHGHGISRGARPRIIRITRSCRTESRIGYIGIGANPTCWQLAAWQWFPMSRAGQMEILTKQAGLSAGESATKSRSHPAFAAGGHTRIPSDFPRSVR